MAHIETITEFGTGIEYIADLNNAVNSGEIDDVILYSEALHEKNISKIADKIVNERKRVVLIAGPSSSGKTSFTKRLCIQLWLNGRKPIYLGTDDYFLSRDKIRIDENGNKNFENLDAFDLDFFNNQLRDISEGKEVDIPRFDFISGHPVFGERLTKAYPDQVIVVEGIHGLNPALAASVNEDIKFRIFIAPMTEMKINSIRKIQTSDVRKIRRMVRDNSHRGWDALATLKSWEQVRNGEYENILPYKDNADVQFDTSLPYELAALKRYAMPLLTSIDGSSKYFDEAQRLIEILSFVNELKEERVIAGNSIIREFIGGSTVAD